MKICSFDGNGYDIADYALHEIYVKINNCSKGPGIPDTSSFSDSLPHVEAEFGYTSCRDIPVDEGDDKYPQVYTSLYILVDGVYFMTETQYYTLETTESLLLDDFTIQS